jgi:hypothetical protein
MKNGAYCTKCRRCSSVVYDGPWISPAERLRLQQDHRSSCPADVIPIRESLSTSSRVPTVNLRIAAPAKLRQRVKSEVKRPQGYDTATVAGMVGL